MFGFGFDLTLAKAGGGAAAPVAGISALEVLGPAVLPDGVDAAVPNGWVAKAVLPDDGASAFDPSKIVLTVSDPGFDSQGNATAIIRTITGTAIVRRQHPNQAQRLNAASGGVRTVYFALSDDIYQGSTITGASASAGYYGAAAAGMIASVTNASTLAYPKAQFAWMNTQHERVSASTCAVEGVAFHRHAMNGQQVACVRYQAMDAQGVPNLSPIATASAPQLSAIQTQGQIAEVWAADLSTATLAQGDLCRVNARVYPWIGDASAVLDLIADGIAVTGNCTTMNPQTPLRFLNDRTGGYGGLHAAVRIGASGGTVQASWEAATATPYATIQAAIAALVSANNAGKGHNNHSGSTVWLMETAPGGGAAHIIGASSGSAAGSCWTDIRPDPAATGTVKAVLSATAGQASLLRWQVAIEVTGAFNMNGGGGTGGNVMIALENMTLHHAAAASAPINFGFGIGFAKNLTLTGGANVYPPFGGFSTNRCQMRAIGVIATDTVAPSVGNANGIYPWTLIGCTFANWQVQDNQWSFAANLDTLDGGIVYNNRFTKMQTACLIASDGAPPYAARGLAIVQNVFERSGTPSTAALGIGNDGQVAPFANINEHHNTIPGTAGSSSIARTNRAYADAAGAVGVQKRMTSRFNLFHEFNVKSDSFTSVTAVTGRTGAWRYRYQVGCAGNVVVAGGSDGTTAPGEASWLGDAWPADARPSGAAVTFANNAAGTGGAGGGDYALTGVGNHAYARVRPGAGVLRYDLGGNARANDGSGAAGAFERSG